MAYNHFSDSSSNGQCPINGDARENEDSNAANNPNFNSVKQDQSSVNIRTSINNELKMHHDKAGTNSAVRTGASDDPNSEQSFVHEQSHHLLEPEYLSSSDISPATLYENLIEEMDKNIIMLKKSLDKVLEMRVSMAELKLNLKEISSPELVCKAAELNTQLTSLEERHVRFNEMVLSLKQEIHPSANSDTSKMNVD